MKKYISIIFVVLLTFSALLCGCNNKGAVNDYTVNNDGIINIGVLLPQSGDAKDMGDEIADGIKFANELAPGVNINNEKKHLVNLIFEDINGDLNTASDNFKDNKVAAVICAGINKEKTDTVISSFKNESTALLFTDCSSSQVLSLTNALTIGIPYSYQTSVVASYFIEEGFKSGAVVVPDDEYGKKVSKSFKDTFVSTGGTSVSEYLYNSDDPDFNAKTIAGSELEFVFLVGAEQDTKEMYCELMNAEAKMPVVLSEIYDTEGMEDELFNDVVFISKFEQDDNNFIGTDFIKSYSQLRSVSVSDVTSSTAYGYDAYMLVYGALMSFNSNSQSSMLSANSDDSTHNYDSSDIKSSQVLSAIKAASHMGVTDSISFTENGSVNTNFLYLDAVQNKKAIMLNKYNYNHETK